MATPYSRGPLLALARLANRASGRERRVRGFVDALVGGTTVVGWAQDQSDPARRLEVQMIRGEEILAFGVADLSRKDLTEREIGDGRYGFRLRVPPALLDGQTHSVRLFAVTERGKVLLQRGEVTIAPVSPAEVPVVEPKPARQQAMVGALERLNGRTLHGWAYNPDQPDAPALVDFFDDELFLGSTLADRSRPRLYEKGFPSGARGFAFELPGGLPMAGVRLRARVSGTSYDLKRTRDYERGSAQTTADPAEAAAPSIAPDLAGPSPVLRSIAPRHPPLTANGMPMALWPVGPDHRDATLADWSAQAGDARLVCPEQSAPLPAPWGEASRQVAGPDPVAAAVRAGAWLLFAPAGARLDPAIAGSLARLPGGPDVVVLGDEGWLPGEAARLASWLAPDRPGSMAVRADALLDYPGALADEIARGRLTPLRRWLAERDGLRWAGLPCPEPGGAAEAPDPDLPARLGTGWQVVDGKAQPARRPERVSLGLWAGWDEPGLPALRALVEAAGDGPADVLVPSDGDETTGRTRLAAAEALLAELARTAVRARLVDCGAGEDERIAALLHAIDGEVGVLSDGRACPDAPTFHRMTAWALDPRVGPVGLTTPAWSTAARLRQASIHPLSHPDAAAPVSFVSFGLMAVAAHRITGVGASALDPAGPAASALVWSLRLQAHGWQPIAVAGDAAGQAPGAFAGGSLPWPVEAILRAEGLPR